MKTTLGKLRELIKEAMGRCPTCGGPTTNFGATEAWECDACGGQTDLNDKIEQLKNAAQNHRLRYDVDAHSINGRACPGLIDDSLVGKGDDIAAIVVFLDTADDTFKVPVGDDMMIDFYDEVSDLNDAIEDHREANGTR